MNVNHGNPGHVERESATRLFYAAVLFLAIAVALALLFWWPGPDLYKVDRFIRLSSKVKHSVQRIEIARQTASRSIPKGVRDYDDYLNEITGNAVANALNGPNSVDFDGLERFERELALRADNANYVETYVWIWANLGSIGPSGRYYLPKHRPEFERALNARSNYAARVPGPDTHD